MSLPPFPGFGGEAFAFLRALEQNNRRAWFKARKDTYEAEVKGPLECLVADVARRLHSAGLPLTGDPKRSPFRIYRDLRFTDDKRPYKSHASALFDRSGEKAQNGVVYVHVDPGASFLAAGFHRPKASYLRPVRRAIVEEPARFYAMLDDMDANGLPVDPGQETLTGMPRGFSKYRDTELAEHLRWKAYLARRSVSDEELKAPAFAEQVVAMTRDSLPLLEYVWGAHDA